MEQQIKWMIKMASAMLLLLLTIGLLYQLHMEQSFQIYDSSLRFHVRAASDASMDQQLKQLVRDDVLREMREIADGAQSAEQLKNTLKGELRNIAQTAVQTLRKNGCEKGVKVSITKERFPVRNYGNVVFPAGVYHALRVDIGEAEGHNWWCAIYPELCYNTKNDPLSEKGKKDLKKDLSEKERKTLLNGKNHYGFKILEWFSHIVS